MKKLLTAAALAVMLTLGIGAFSPAHEAWANYFEIHIAFNDDGSRDEYGIEKDDDGNIIEIRYYLYDKDGNFIKGGIMDPADGDGGSGGGGPDMSVAIQLAKQNGGAAYDLEVEFFGTPVGIGLIGKSIIPVHNPDPAGLGSLGYDFEGEYGGGPGGIDLNAGSIAEQIKNNAGKGKKKDDDGDDDGDGSGGPGAGTNMYGLGSGSMELINPVPELRPQLPTVKSLMARVPQSVFGNPDGSWRALNLRPPTAATHRTGRTGGGFPNPSRGTKSLRAVGPDEPGRFHRHYRIPRIVK